MEPPHLRVDINEADKGFSMMYYKYWSSQQANYVCDASMFFWPLSSFFGKPIHRENLNRTEKVEQGENVEKTIEMVNNKVNVTNVPTKYYDVFISYRRQDEEGKKSGTFIARSIYQALQIKQYKVFFDYSECTDGEFEERIIPAIRNSRHFILILTKNALDRCVNKKDWVRREIRTAVNSHCKIIPVNPDYQFGDIPDCLPKYIKKLSKTQYSDLNTGSLFDKSIEKMIEERFEKE